MPIHRGHDKGKGSYYQWGNSGKKYYFDPKDEKSEERAFNKARKQAQAIYASGWRE